MEKERGGNNLGIIWGAMMLTNGLVQGGYEMLILDWPMPCPQTYIFLAFGAVSLAGLFAVRKGFSRR